MEQKLKLELIKKFLRKEGEEGFSLIELVVVGVVAVLSILSSIAIPTFKGLILKSRRVAASTYVDLVLKSATVFIHIKVDGLQPGRKFMNILEIKA